jgi:hypothetical protein
MIVLALGKCRWCSGGCLGRKKRGLEVPSAAIALGERERGLRGVFFSHLSPFKTFCYIERSNTIFISRSGTSKG